MDKLQRATVNSLMNVAGFIAPIVVNLIATPVLLNQLGPDSYGVQNLTNAIMGYFFVLEAGMTFAMIRYLAEDRARGEIERQRSFVKSGLLAFALIGIIGMIIIMLASGFFATRLFSIPVDLQLSATIAFRIAGVGFFAGMIAFWGRAVSSGLQRYELNNGITIVSNVAGTGLGVVLIYFYHYGLVAFVAAKIGISLLACIPYLVAVGKLIGTYDWRARLDTTSLRLVVGYARFGIIGRLNGVVYMWLDNTLIALWLGTAALAAYVPPFTIMNLAIYFIGSMIGLVMPLASEYYHMQRNDEYRALLIAATRFVVALTTVIFVQIYVLGDSFFTLWLGNSYGAQDTMLVGLMAIAGFLATASMGVASNVLPVAGHMPQYTTYSTVRSIVFALGCVLLIRPVGIEGAALALVCAACVDFLFALWAYPRYLHVPLIELAHAAYLRPLLLGVALGVAATLALPLTTTWLGFLLVVVCLSSAYVALGFRVGVFKDTEWRALQSLWRLATHRFAPSS